MASGGVSVVTTEHWLHRDERFFCCLLINFSVCNLPTTPHTTTLRHTKTHTMDSSEWTVVR